MASYVQINPDGTRQTVKYNRCHDGPVSERLTILKRLRWLRTKAKNNPLKGKYRDEITEASRRLSALDLSLSRSKHRTRQPERRAGVPRPVHTKPSAAGSQEPPLSRPVSGEKTSCTAAASIEGSSSSQTNHTSHTPSTFAAPTQFLETADARGPVVSPDKNGI